MQWAGSLDRYLRTQASQDVRRKANGVFILVEPDKPDVVLGYYTLCATGVAQGDVPAAARLAASVPRCYGVLLSRRTPFHASAAGLSGGFKLSRTPPA